MIAKNFKHPCDLMLIGRGLLELTLLTRTMGVAAQPKIVQ
jgi:hypothetical protein